MYTVLVTLAAVTRERVVDEGAAMRRAARVRTARGVGNLCEGNGVGRQRPAAAWDELDPISNEQLGQTYEVDRVAARRAPEPVTWGRPSPESHVVIIRILRPSLNDKT